MGAHVDDDASHARPAPGSQPGPVRSVGSHAAPCVVTAAAQTPIWFVVASKPTHESPAPHGAPTPQG
jgi:hypothetical protein